MSILDLIGAGVPAPQSESLAQVRAQQNLLAQQQFGLRGMLTQQQAANLNLQREKQAMADEMATRQIFRQAYGGQTSGVQDTPQGTVPPQPGMTAPQTGAAPGIVPAMAAQPNAADIVNKLRGMGLHTAADAVAQGFAKLNETQSIAKKNFSEANDFDAKAAVANGSMMANGLSAVLAAPPDQQAAVYNREMTGLLRRGVITPNQVEPFPGTAVLQQHRDALVPLLTRLQETQEAGKNAMLPDQQKEAAANAVKAGVLANQYQEGGMPLSDQQRIALENQRNVEAARHNKVDERLSGGRLAIENAHLGLAQKEYGMKYGDALGNLTGANKSIAEKVATGDFDPAQLSRMPGKEAIIAGAMALNPNWTPQIYATKKSFTDPEKTQAKNLGTLSRIVGHLGRFEDNSRAIGFAPGYAMGANLTGGAAKLNEDSHAIASEFEKLVSGGVGTEGQTQSWMKALKSPIPGQRQQAIDEISHLIGSQFTGMNQTYKAATGQGLPLDKYTTPETRSWMQKKGIDVSGGAVPAGGHAVTHVYNPATGQIEAK